MSSPSERGWEAVDHAEERLQDRAAARQRVDTRRRRRRSGAAWILRTGLPLLGAAAVLVTLQSDGGDLSRWSASTAALIVGAEVGVPAVLAALTARRAPVEALLWFLVVLAAEVALVFGVGFALLGLGPA